MYSRPRQTAHRLATLLLGLASRFAAADDLFTKELLAVDVYYASSVATADLDGDGDLDAAFAAQHAHEIGWVSNDDGIFEAMTVRDISRASGLSRVACADVDGDGLADVVAAATNDDTLYFHRNRGDGTFEQRTISSAAKGPRAIALADVDGDGDLDVVVATGWMYSSGGAAPSPPYVSDVWYGDLDWYENDGTGFRDEAQTTVHAVGAGGGSIGLMKAVSVGDMDGDGAVDILAYDSKEEGPSWWRNPGAGVGVWDQKVVVANSDNAYSTNGLSESWYPSTVGAHDFNGDGLLDVEFVVWRSGMILAYVNQGDGTYVEQLVYRNTDTRCSCASAGDFDGDGDLDLVAGYEIGSLSHSNPQGDWLEWFPQIGVTELKWDAPIRMGEADLPSALAVADVDGDGDLDVVSSSKDDDTIALWRNMRLAATRKPTPAPSSGSGGGNDADADGASVGVIVGLCVAGAVLVGATAMFAWFRKNGGDAKSVRTAADPSPARTAVAMPAAAPRPGAPPKPPRKDLMAPNTAQEDSQV